MDIVCFPDMEWDHGLWTNRQQVMGRLPAIEADVRVLYVAPPRFALSGTRLAPAGRLAEGPAPRMLHRPRERLWVLQIPLPMPNRVLRRHAGDVLDRLVGGATRWAAQRLGFRRPVVWSYTPLGLAGQLRLAEQAFVYDVVDDYGALAHYRAIAGDSIRDLDCEATRRADLVFVTSEYLLRQRAALNDHVVLARNAADIDLFATAREALPRPAELPPGGPLIGFHGALTREKLDTELLAEVAARRPQWTFVLIGPEPGADHRVDLSQLPNVRRLSRRTPAELPGYLAHFDAAFVPYRRNDYTLGVSALKVVEYLAAGVPVVTTDLPGFREHGDRIAVAGTPEAAVAALQAAIDEPPAPVPLDELRASSWDEKARRQLSTVRELVA